MNKLLILSILTYLFSTSIFASDHEIVTPIIIHDAKIIRITDGDTVVIRANWIPDPLKKEISIKIFNIDTPEKDQRSKCQIENQLHFGSSLFTKRVIDQSTKQQVIFVNWDKVGIRIRGDILLDGQSLRKMLIDGGFAKEYVESEKYDWCKRP